MRLPKIFKESTLRVVTSITEGRIRIGFDVEDQTVYMNISVKEALEVSQLIRDNSEMPSGIRICEVSSNSPIIA